MQFNSLAFLVFFPIVCALAALLRGEKHIRIRHIMLLIASYVFYGWWNWKFCFLMLLMSVVAYVCAISHSRSGKKLPVYGDGKNVRIIINPPGSAGAADHRQLRCHIFCRLWRSFGH